MKLVPILAAMLAIEGCVAVKVADATISTGAMAVKTTAKVGTGAVGLITPDGKSEKDEDPHCKPEENCKKDRD